jgi:hypothetical protein
MEKEFSIERDPADHSKEDAILKRAAIGWAGLAVVAVFATAASAHMWSGNHHDRGDHHTRSGWNYGISHSGYCYDDPGGVRRERFDESFDSGRGPETRRRFHQEVFTGHQHGEGE